jgi:diguanylate cyclase (GGDEF)-like protein
MLGCSGKENPNFFLDRFLPVQKRIVQFNRMPSKSISRLVTQQIEQLSLTKFQRLNFPAPLEERFERDTAAYRSGRLWIEGVAAIALFNLFLFANHFIVHAVRWHDVFIRSAIVTPLALAVNISMLWNPKRVYRETSIALAACAICFTHLYLETTPNAMGPAYAQIGVIVCILFVNVVMRLQFWYAVSATAVMTVGDLLFMYHDKFHTPAEKVFGSSLTVCAISMTVIANYSLGREERLGYLLRLRGELQSEELSQNNEELTRISNMDSLTGLANRHAFDREYQRMWREALESGAPLSAVVIDIDRFKKLNDLRGHLYGDRVLKRVATLLLQGLRGKDDFAARFGGEEFVVLLPGTYPEGALLVAERIRKLVEVAGSPALESYEALDQVWATVSCGVATCWPAPGKLKEHLIEAADKALYQAKDNGRNQVCLDDLSVNEAAER